MPTYLGVYGKNRKEQIQRVETVSFPYLLLGILNNFVWTIYAYRTSNADLAIICLIRKSFFFA